MSATVKQRIALDQYADLMEEAKLRLQCIDHALSGQTGLLAPAVREFCFLQLRMLCEDVALGCLTVHGDIGPTAKLRKQYAADKIISQLERLHPNFYPMACTQTCGGPAIYDAQVMKDGYLTKPELLRLYKRCGNHLHRGNIETLFSATGPHSHPHFPDIEAWRTKMYALLKYHAIFLFNEKQMVLFVLNNIEAKGRVTWALLESEEIASLLKS